MRRCELHQLHVVTYENGMRLQQKLAEMRQNDEIDDQLLLLEHPAVITLGRSGDSTNLLASPDVLRRERVRYFETTRGGDITYHGPGQIVGYPIIDLNPDRRDVHRYVRDLEEVLMRTAADYGTLVIVVTHDLGLAARFADTVLVLSDGRLVSHGVSAEALSEQIMADVFRISAYRAEYQRETVIVPWAEI